MKTLVAALFISATVSGFAHAEVKDRTIPADVTPHALYLSIVGTATAMCQEAASKGEVVNVGQCVEIVVEKTISEINRPSLTSYAQTTSPALAVKAAV